MSDNMIIDVDLDSFKQQVIEASFHQPVLIDFWADWCEPCKTLTLLLEKVVASYQGGLILAKVDCDAEQELVSHFGVRNLPTVVLFKDGQPIDGFTGNQAEASIQEMLAKHITQLQLPIEETVLEQAEALYVQGQIMAAEQRLKQLLTDDNSQPLALILYARCLAHRHEFAEADTILESITGDEYKDAVAIANIQIAFLKQAKTLPDEATLQTSLTADPSEVLSYQLAIVQLANQQYELAMENLFSLFKQNRSFQEDLPRKTLVQIFELLGNNHPLVTSYRKKLYQALY